MSAYEVRHQGRERAMQLLFALDYTEEDWREVCAKFWVSFPAKPGVKKYAEQLVTGIYDHLYDLDDEIVDALDHWLPDRVGRIERSLLRIALYEIRHGKDVPPAVAINEAIDLAKEYIGEDAPRFINGVLDRLKKKGPPVKVDPVVESSEAEAPEDSEVSGELEMSDQSGELDEAPAMNETEEDNEHS